MVVETVDISIICNMCSRHENARPLESKEEYYSKRIIKLTNQQKDDKEYLKKILFDRNLGLKMQPPILGERIIDIDWVFSEKNKHPNDLFFQIGDNAHICSICIDRIIKGL
jgi:hypothetical protein